MQENESGLSVRLNFSHIFFVWSYLNKTLSLENRSWHWQYQLQQSVLLTAQTFFILSPRMSEIVPIKCFSSGLPQTGYLTPLNLQADKGTDGRLTRQVTSIVTDVRKSGFAY